MDKEPPDHRSADVVRQMKDLIDMPDPRTPEDLIERDRLLYGAGFGRRLPDGSIEHLPAQTMIIFTTPRQT